MMKLLEDLPADRCDWAMWRVTSRATRPSSSAGASCQCSQQQHQPRQHGFTGLQKHHTKLIINQTTLACKSLRAVHQL